jgi:hypothetical protein
MNGSKETEDLWLEEDMQSAALWQQAELMANAPPRPAKGYVVVPLHWLARMRPKIRSVEQFVVLLLLYRQCLLRRSKTVVLPNSELVALGISRYGKYRALSRLVDAGAVTFETRNGRASRVTLHWFP